MRALRNAEDANQIADPAIRALVLQRFDELSQIEDYTLEELGTFWLIEPGDSIDAIEANAGCWIRASLFSDAQYGDPDYSPCHEFLEAHATCWEAVWIFNDAGFGTILFIPRHESGLDETLIAYCLEYATPAQTSEEASHAALHP